MVQTILLWRVNNEHSNKESENGQKIVNNAAIMDLKE